MNRMEEYNSLLQELEQPVPGLEQSYDRAYYRKQKRQRIVRPVVVIAASLAFFIGVINISAPVATLCSQIPFLAELAQAVTFSDSLSDAVANNYVQPFSLSQTDGEVTATIEYAIVDEKQIHLFFRLESDVYPNLKALPQGSAVEETSSFSGNYTSMNWMVPNGELQSIAIDCLHDEFPDSLHLQLNVLDMDRTTDEAISQLILATEAPLLYPLTDISSESYNYVAHFDFILEFNPAFADTGAKVYSIYQTITVNEQTLTITNMEVYPTHIRLNVSEDASNTAWLTGLDFQIITDNDIKYVPPFAGTKGILNRNEEEQIYTCSFLADTTYFDSSKPREIVITGARWETKQTEELIVNLETGAAEQLADQITLFHFSKEPTGWDIEFLRNSRHSYYSVDAIFYDEEGTAYPLETWESETIGYKTAHFFETTPPDGHSFQKMSLHIVHFYEADAEEPITLRVK